MITVTQPPTPGSDLIFVSALPMLLQDIIKKADTWGNDGKAGRIDPFVETYDVSCIFSVHFLSALSLPYASSLCSPRLLV